MLLFKLRIIRSPWNGVFRGYRMALAIPNEAGPDSKPSFTHKKFLIAESGDFTFVPDMVQILTWIQDHARGETVHFLDT